MTEGKEGIGNKLISNMNSKLQSMQKNGPDQKEINPDEQKIADPGKALVGALKGAQTILAENTASPVKHDGQVNVEI